MIDLPELPIFDIPKYLQKKPPPEVIFKWMADNLCRLKQTKQIDRLRKQESRRPVDVRFVL